MSLRTPHPESAERRTIRRLLAARGIGQHALFLTQREGQRLPGGLEALSGFILTDRCVVYSFWLGWDARRGRFSLEPFAVVQEPDAVFAEDTEYQQARRALGL